MKRQRRNDILKEDNCKCGADIPRGYGYYNYGKPIRCMDCGTINQRREATTK